MLNLKVQFLSYLLLILSHSSQSEDYCCEFQDSSMCGCINRGTVFWNWSGSEVPNLAGITDFNNSISALEEYEWIQSPDFGDASLITKLISINISDEISIDYYRHSASSATNIQLYFVRTSDAHSVQFLNEFIQKGWHNITVECGLGGDTIQCCQDYPCNGLLKVTGTLQQATNDLLAFKNILINNCPVEETTTEVASTTEESTTTEAPVNSRFFCNHFESPSSGWTLEEWEYSVVSQPDLGDIPFTPYDGDYAWANNTSNGKIISPEVHILINDQYSLDYYVYSSVRDIDNSLLIYFYDSDADAFNPLTLLQTSENWTAFTGHCGLSKPCCVEYPCNGQFVLEGSYASGEVFIAVDNLQLNQGCIDLATCCDFESSNICGMTSIGQSDEAMWKWSGSEVPVLNIPLPSGGFMYSEIVNKTDAVQSTLRSDLLIAYPNSTIVAKYYVNAVGSSTELDVRFHRQSNDEVLTLDYLTLSLRTWYEYSVQCLGPHGACCNTLDGCAGWIEFVAISDGENGTVFAVDNLDVDSQCNPAEDNRKSDEYY